MKRRRVIHGIERVAHICLCICFAVTFWTMINLVVNLADTECMFLGYQGIEYIFLKLSFWPANIIAFTLIYWVICNRLWRNVFRLLDAARNFRREVFNPRFDLDWYIENTPDRYWYSSTLIAIIVIAVMCLTQVFNCQPDWLLGAQDILITIGVKALVLVLLSELMLTAMVFIWMVISYKLRLTRYERNSKL